MLKDLPRKGFTLIELLVVITILGILAVAVLAAINPIEQFNKARDTGMRADSTELSDAMQRFYTNYGCFPWDFDASTTPQCASPSTIYNGGTAKKLGDPTISVTNASNCPASFGLVRLATPLGCKLILSNELKPDFVVRISNYTAVLGTQGTVALSSTDPTNANGYIVHVSFIPYSQTYKNKANFSDAPCTTLTTVGANLAYVCTPGTNF